MAITTTEYATFEKKAFFDNREWLNQENWQMYFGGSLPSGVLVKGKLESSGVDYTSALSRQVLNANYIGFRAGSILADGIFATYEGGNSIPVIKSGDVDRLFVARVSIGGGTVKIVGMTKVAAEYGYTPVLFAKMLLQDESLAMTRNTETYDIPLCYEVFNGDVFDLRRLIYLPGQSPDVEINYNRTDVTNSATIPGILYGRDFVQIYGGMNYNVNFVSGDTSTSFYVYPNPSCSEKSAVVKLANDSSTAKQIRIPLKWKGLQFTYSWLESWNTDPNRAYLYKELVAGDRMTMIFTPNGHETAFNYAVTNKSSASGGGIDSEDYFTKQEIAAQMVLKANVSDMNDALAQKEDKTALGSLAYQSQADYVSQVINKPTLGALASKDQVNIATEVNGILPIANGGTGASNLAEIIGNIFSPRYYFVSDIGSDNNTGTYDSPFKTIQHAIDSCGVLNTSYIYISPGTYSEDLYISPGKHIVFSSKSHYYPTYTDEMYDTGDFDKYFIPESILLIGTNNTSIPLITIDNARLDFIRGDYNLTKNVYYTYDKEEKSHNSYILLIKNNGILYVRTEDYLCQRTGVTPASAKYTSKFTLNNLHEDGKGIRARNGGIVNLTGAYIYGTSINSYLVTTGAYYNKAN